MERPTWCHIAALILLLGGVSGCASTVPPSKTDDVCAIFQEKPEWYWTALDTQKATQVPVPVQMAIIHQESHFRANARPERPWILGVVPWFRPSTAYGYAQILDSTWEDFVNKTGHAGSRSDFASATDFIGWYGQQAYVRAEVPRNDAYKMYLAYHEGVGGYTRKTYLDKPWLIKVAQKVKKQSNRYTAQLKHCAKRISKGRSWFW